MLRRVMHVVHIGHVNTLKYSSVSWANRNILFSPNTVCRLAYFVFLSFFVASLLSVSTMYFIVFVNVRYCFPYTITDFLPHPSLPSNFLFAEVFELPNPVTTIRSSTCHSSSLPHLLS